MPLVGMAIGGAVAEEPNNRSPLWLKLLLVIEYGILAFMLFMLYDLQGKVADIKERYDKNSCNCDIEENKWTGHCGTDRVNHIRNDIIYSSCKDVLR